MPAAPLRIGLFFPRHRRRGCVFLRPVTIVSLETSSGPLVFQSPLLSIGGVVPVGPPKWLPPPPPLTSNLFAGRGPTAEDEFLPLQAFHTFLQFWYSHIPSCRDLPRYRLSMFVVLDD